MDERKTTESTVESVQADGANMLEQAFARGSRPLGESAAVAPDRTEHSVMEGLPPAKAERIAAMRRELAELQRQLIDAQQRIATELQGRAEDAERFEALEARLQVQEAKVREEATRNAEMVTEIASLRSQLTIVGTTVEDLRRDVAARDAQIEDARRDHRGVTEQLETQSSLLSQTKALLATRDGELATRTAERDTEQATKSRLERELEDHRKQHREVASDLEAKLASLRDANALIATRDAELATLTSERDGLKGELATLTSERDGLKGELATLTSERDGLKGELAASSAKRREIADQLARLGQDLMEGVGGTSQPNPAASATRAEPPKPPAPPTAAHSEPPRQVEKIEGPKSRSRVPLVVLGGILGCVATIAVVKWSSSSSASAGERQGVGDSPSAALVSERPSTAVPPAPSSDPNGHPSDQNDPHPVAPAPAENTTDGVLVLPQEAADHRVFVDGRVVAVKNSRAVVPCGTREIRIGSRGTPRTLDVACSGETAVPSDAVDR